MRNQAHRNLLLEQTKSLKDPKIRELIVNNGIGIHHAGMDSSDRNLIENLFLNSNLYVLCKKFINSLNFRILFILFKLI